MAITPTVYGLFLDSLHKGKINFGTDVFKAMLVGSGYTPNQGTHQYKNSITSEVTGTGYTATGQAISITSIAYSQATKLLTVSAGNPVWTTATISPAYLVVYDDTAGGSDATKPLVLYIDFGGIQTVTAQNFQYTWPSGILFTSKVP